MGRPRKPTRVLELKGAFKKNPSRKAARENEPEATGPFGQPPDCLDEAQRARWEEIAEWGRNYLSSRHRGVAELTCRLWMLDRGGKANAGQQSLLLTCWTRLGMTPADESRVKAPPADKKKSVYGSLTG